MTLFVTFRYILLTCIWDILMLSSCDFVILVFKLIYLLIYLNAFKRKSRRPIFGAHLGIA